MIFNLGKTILTSKNFVQLFLIFRPTAEQEEQRLYDSPAYKEMEHNFQDMLEVLGHESGIGSTPLSFQDMEKVFEPLYAVVTKRLSLLV
jgi:hypothetical protein